MGTELKPQNPLANRLIIALETAGYEPYAYSGRHMYGARCVAVNLPSTDQLFVLGRELRSDFTEPMRDDMGKGIVAYWPEAKLED